MISIHTCQPSRLDRESLNIIAGSRYSWYDLDSHDFKLSNKKNWLKIGQLVQKLRTIKDYSFTKLKSGEWVLG